MLTARRLIGLVAGVALALGAAKAHAQDDEPEGVLHRPIRQTVSVADDLIGQLSPDGQTLYFVSNRNQRSEIFAQNVDSGHARRLFDDGAEVTWPRVSPDGRYLLYVSFGDHALGQLCVRRLPDGSDRRCLEDVSAIRQAEWRDSSRILAVARRSLHGDLQLLDVNAASDLSSRPLLDRNLTGPAVSPDGQWLVYVPIERDVPSVGPAFAAHAARRLEVVPLSSPTSPAISLTVDLPGLTGQPAFARDGRSLVVVQFVDDTNHDSVIDANDDGVLFRVPFSVRDGRPALGPPEQLTESSFDCEYPSPAGRRLIATCAKRRGLEVYALRLEGEVPPDWSSDRLAAEIAAAGSRSEQQLLASLRLARETAPTARRLALLTLVRLHLELDQHDAAEFYAGRLTDTGDPATEGLSQVVTALVAQRRAVKNRERGLVVGRFAEQARQRLDALRLPPSGGAAAIALAHVVRSEIADSLGDKARAREELEAVTLDESVPVPIALPYYERADALYRELDEREPLIAACRRLSALSSLTADERLRYARAAVRNMVRGLAYDEAAARVLRERAGVADPELAFALEIAEVSLAIRDARPTRAVTDRIVALYTRETRPGRRRALVDDIVARATPLRANEVIEAVAERYLADTQRGTTERRAAERLYRRAMTARALRRSSEGDRAGARADFDAIAAETDSYEAVVGAIDLRLEAGESPAAIAALYTGPRTPLPLTRFARAYLLSTQLPALEGEAATRASAEALGLLRSSWGELAGKRIVHATNGGLLHDRYMRTGELAFAERANIDYGIALELTPRGRLRAAVLGQLGILHTEVGNYRIAVGHFEDRAKLPYTDGVRDLAVHLSHARALLHVAREADAADAADRAWAMVERRRALAPYRELALDRAAVANLAAGRFARAVMLYDTLVPLLDAASGPAAVRNRFVARVARAAAAVGAGSPARALADLREVERQLNDPAVLDSLTRRHASGDRAVEMYRVLAMGLRAQAYRTQGRLEEESRALAERRAALQQRFALTQRPEDERSAMLTELQLALNARERGDLLAAASFTAQALAHADDLRTRAHGQIDNGQLDALWLAAQLTLETKTPVVSDLPRRLDAAASAVAATHDPALRTYARWFEIYLPVVGPKKE